MSALPVAEQPPVTVLHDGIVDDRPPAAPSPFLSRRRLSQILLLVSLLTLWALTHLLVLSSLEQGHDQSRLYEQLRSELAEGVAPTGAGVAAGSPVSLLSLPSLGVQNLVVVEGARSEQLSQGPGHVPGSVLPGQAGVSVVAGKALTYGAPFAALPLLKVGHLVEVTTQQGEFTYTVRGIRREGDALPPALTEGASRLILVTADRSSADGTSGLVASDIVYIDTELTTGAAPTGLVSSVDPEQRWMSAGADTTAVTHTVLAVQLLLLVAVAVTWSWSRWHRPATVLLGAPCLVASLWLVSSVSSRLLPGLL